jgi:hypothetical protein
MDKSNLDIFRKVFENSLLVTIVSRGMFSFTIHNVIIDRLLKFDPLGRGIDLIEGLLRTKSGTSYQISENPVTLKARLEGVENPAFQAALDLFIDKIGNLEVVGPEGESILLPQKREAGAVSVFDPKGIHLVLIFLSARTPFA